MTSSGDQLPPLPQRVLVAEDDFTTACSLRLALNVNGHQVQIASTGEEALSLFETGEYGLVITDFKLPGMDGLELAEAVKSRNAAVPVILITAYAETVQARPDGVSNVDMLLGKPVSLEKLQAAIRGVLLNAANARA